MVYQGHEVSYDAVIFAVKDDIPQHENNISDQFHNNHIYGNKC